MKQTLYFKEKEIPVENHHLYGEWKNTPIPSYAPTFEEISNQMKINSEIVMKEISDHCDKEIEWFKRETK